MENPALNGLGPARAVDEANRSLKLVQHRNHRVVGDRLRHHQAQRETIFGHVGNLLADGVAVAAQLDGFAVDPDFASIGRVHAKKREGEFGTT